MSSNIEWNDTIKKEARGVNNEDLGEVQEVTDGYVLVQKGLINKEKFYIPLDQAKSYDGSVLLFGISEDEIKSRYMSDLPPPPQSFTKDASSRIQRSEGQQEENTKIPLTDEKLDVSKENQDSEIKITKEPIKETKTVQVPLTHEEVTIQTRPPSGNTKAETPVSSTQDIHIPVKKEEIGEVSKTPYVKEEAVVKKKPVTETKEVTEETTAEGINT
ncbi:MAG: YsnF/AvaK domain-containing protein [Candidatus Nitrosocosmicus sp.]